MFWGNLFHCASGVYLLGTSHLYGNLVISRMNGAHGDSWTEPTPLLPSGVAVHTGNAGVLVSRGRVFCSFEVAPNRSEPKPATIVTGVPTLNEHATGPLTFRLPVEDGPVFPVHTLVELEQSQVRVRCWVDDHDGDVLLLRPLRSTATDSQTDRTALLEKLQSFTAGATIATVSATGRTSRDFWVQGIDADENADLLHAPVWRLSNALANPAYAQAEKLNDLFAWHFPVADDGELPPPSDPSAWSGWLEGAPVRLEHLGSGSDVRPPILNLLRVAGAPSGNWSARTLFFDAGATPLHAKFERFSNDPGMGVTHAGIRWDSESGLYWMVSNVNRESTRDTTGIGLKLASQERSNLALHYSRNASDWFTVGMVAYSRDWVHSFHYPQFIIEGDDLLVIARSHVQSPLCEATVDHGPDGSTAGVATAGHHNSNAVTFHRVANFRDLANREFIDYLSGTDYDPCMPPTF
jgi:hypothetical protein